MSTQAKLRPLHLAPAIYKLGLPLGIGPGTTTRRVRLPAKGKRTPAQLDAEKRYREKQAGRPCLPGVRITDSQADLLERVGKRNGGKTAAIFKGLELLDASDPGDTTD